MTADSGQFFSFGLFEYGSMSNCIRYLAADGDQTQRAARVLILGILKVDTSVCFCLHACENDHLYY